MSKYSNPRSNIFIVQNNQQYPELGTLTDTLRANINDVVITRADYPSLHNLAKSISQSEKNMIIILTKDLNMDAQLVTELEKAHDKNVKILLYPRGFISNNRYQVVNNQDQITQVAVLYFTGVMSGRIASYKSQLPVEQASPIKKIQNIDRFQNIQMASSMQNNTVKSLSSMTNQQISTKLIILQGRDKQFNSLMSTLNIRYKNDPKVQCRQIVNIQQINGLTDNKSKMILIIHEDQIDQKERMFLLQQLRNRMSIIQYTNNPNPLINNLFQLQTNRIEAIQYFVSPQQVHTYANREPSIMASNASNMRSNNLMSSSLSPNRIQMKSAQKIIKSLNSRSLNPTQLYAYDNNNNPYFRQFYSKIPTNFKVISHISQVPQNRQSIILSPIQQASSIVQNLSPSSKLVLYANNMAPNNFISHPSVNMVTSNRQHLMSYLMKQNVTFNNRSFVNNSSAQTKIVESIRDLNLSNVHQGAFPNGEKFMCWTVKGENGEYQTFVGDKADYSDIKLNNASTKVQSYLNQMPTQFGSNHVSSVARPLVGAVSKTQINEIKSSQNFNSSHLNQIIAAEAINSINNNAVNQIIANSHIIPSSVSIKQTIVQPVIPQQQYTIKSNKLNSSRVEQVEYLPQNNFNKVYNYQWDVGLNKQSQSYETNSLNPTPEINSIIAAPKGKVGSVNQFVQQASPAFQVTTDKMVQPIIEQINYTQQSNNPVQMQWYAFRNANNQFILSSQNPMKVNNNFAISNNKDSTSQQINSQYFISPENNKIESTINYQVLVRPPSSSVIAQKYLYKPSTAVVQQIKYIPPQNQMTISTKTPIKSLQHIDIVQTIQYNPSHQNILPIVLPPSPPLPTFNKVVLNTIPTQTTQTLIAQNIKQLIDGNNMITFNEQASKINSKLLDNTPSFIKKPIDLDVFSNTVSLLIKPEERKMKQDQMPSIVITPAFNPSINNEIVSQLSTNSNNNSELILINNSTVKNNKSINSNLIQIRTQTAAQPYVDIRQQPRPSYNYQMSDHIIEPVNRVTYQDNINVGLYNPRQSKSLDNRVSMRTSKAPKLNVSYKQNYQPYVSLEKSKQRYKLNSTDYDVSQENGVKVYRRKTQSLAPSKFIQHLNTPLMKKVQDVYRPRPSNVTIVNQLMQSFDQNPYKISQQPLNEKSIYYNTDISSKQHILNIPKPPKESRVSYTNQYMGGVRGINVTTAPRVSQFNNTSINNTSLRQSQSSSSSKKQLIVFVLSHYHETELQDYLKDNLPNRVHILKYHDERSMTQKALESINENLVCILNTNLHNLDSKLQDIHPNVSIITFDRQKHIGTHPASTQHEVLSMMKKWYFQY